MRRQIRPFIVEVKKKRGDQARKRSIWDEPDLSAIGAETTKKLEKIEPQQAEAIERPSILEDATVSKSTMALLTVQIDQGVGARDLQHKPSDEANIEQVRPRASRRRRRSAEILPRGQRWKRRLPEVLRGRK